MVFIANIKAPDNSGAKYTQSTKTIIALTISQQQ
jgi:hypothetical protein